MRTQKLGCTDLELSRVGLGAWAIGGPWKYGWGPQDEADSIKTISEAMDAGVNWIDTAPLYGHGKSEEIVGKALRQLSAKPIIATKCGLGWDDSGETAPCLKKDSIIEECENSLRRLGVDVIDLYQMHWNQPNEDLEEAYEAMTKCLKDGKVRYVGVSNYSVEELERVKGIHPIASLQPSYSMIDRDVENELLDYCADNKIGVVVYSPMARGLLTGKFTKQRAANLSNTDNRAHFAPFQEPALSVNLDFVEALRPLVEARGITLAQLAIAWTLRTPHVTSAIVGARREGQILETAQAADINLSDHEVREIESLLTTREETLSQTP